jgi:hypothetical protein
MTPRHMLGTLDDAIAVAERIGTPLDATILAFTGAPTILGETGLPVPARPGTYEFTLEQCVRMRDNLLTAARADAGVQP